MNIFKIAIILAAMCSVADTHAKGRGIVLWTQAITGGRNAFYKRLSCIHRGFHPPNSFTPPSVTAELVNVKTPNTSVSCYEPGEEYNVIIKSPSYILGILIMPLKVGLTMYSPELISVGAMRCPRLDRRLFMDSICSDQSVSHKSSFKVQRLTSLTIPWDAPNSTDSCPVEFLYHVYFSYSSWRLDRTMSYPACNETRNETMMPTETKSNSTESGSGSMLETDLEPTSTPSPSPPSTTTLPTKVPTDKSGQ